MVTINILLIQDLTWEYGYDYLLESLSLMSLKGYKFKAVIIGSGPMYAAVMYMINEFSLVDKVLVINNKLYNITPNNRNCDVFIRSSLKKTSCLINIDNINTRCGLILSNRLSTNISKAISYNPRNPTQLLGAYERLIYSNE